MRALKQPAGLAWLGRRPDFAWLWGGQSISLLGTQVSYVAVPLVGVLVLNATPAQMGVLAALQYLPWFLFGLPAGVWVDRWPKRVVLIVTDAGRAVAIATIPLAYALGHLGLPQLFAVSLVVGILTVFFEVAYPAYVPELVTEDDLLPANSVFEASRSLAFVGGSGVGGLLVQAVGAPFAMAGNAATFLVSAASMLAIRRRDTVQTRPDPLGGRARAFQRELWEGVRALAGHRMLLPITLCNTAANFFITGQLALYVLFVTRELRLSPAALGVIFAMGGVGAFLGSAAASRLGSRFGIGATLVGAGLTVGAGILIASGAGLRDSPALIVALVARFLFHGALPVFNITEVSLRQLLMPAALRGRILATGRFLESGVMPLGALAGGLMGTVLGLRGALAVAGLGVAASTLWIVLSPVRRVATTADAHPI